MHPDIERCANKLELFGTEEDAGMRSSSSLEGTRVTATSVCMTCSHRVPSESGRTGAAPGSQGLALLRRTVEPVPIRIWAKLL